MKWCQTIAKLYSFIVFKMLENVNHKSERNEKKNNMTRATRSQLVAFYETHKILANRCPKRLIKFTILTFANFEVQQKR